MSSITRKVGNSGKLSPFWRAKFRGPDGRTVWLTTRCKDSRKSLAIAKLWERSADLAASWELNQAKAQKLMAEVQKVYPHPDTLAITKDLIDRLLRDTIGGALIGQDFAVFAHEWLAGKVGKTAAATYNKYESVVNRFIEFLPERRRTASVGSISPGEIERFHDSELKAGKTAKTVSTAMTILSGLFTAAVAREQSATIRWKPSKSCRLIQKSEFRLPQTRSKRSSRLLMLNGPAWFFLASTLA
jgi:hypothetical protein